MPTMSPGDRVGAGHCSTSPTKIAPFVGRSMTKGAVRPSWRGPATKVVIFQWPCGMALTRRAPRSLRPRTRAMLVVVPVSSMK
jgi:hypothetical protein